MFSLEFTVAVFVTDEETDVTELLWVVVIVDVDVCDMFYETLVNLGVDFKMVGVRFVESIGGVILDETVDFEAVTVIFFETEETGAVDDFAVGFEVVIVTKETGVVDGFTGILEDSFKWLKGTLPVGLVVGLSKVWKESCLKIPESLHRHGSLWQL